MKYYLKFLMPEILFIIGTVSATIGFFFMAGWEYALIFGGAVFLVAAGYVSSVLQGG